MFLRQLTLCNIRSYVQETVTFPEGSTLLAGDIGSGKSTLLLAIEFALFGASRPDLPAEALLRKGTSQGHVELTFTIEQQQITIRRVLKREKDTIKQAAGHIIVNNLKKELLAVELKAEMLRLLGYPDDYLTKNKNYIFRYTIYTPQEEMKFILQEEPELRLDTLRRIFNVDKYKIVRENMHNYLKQFRVTIASTEKKIEPMAGYKNSKETILEQKKELQQELQVLNSSLEGYGVNIKIIQEELNSLEAQQQQFLAIRQQLQLNIKIVEAKEQQRLEIVEQERKVKERLSLLPISTDFTEDDLASDMRQLQVTLNEKVAMRAQAQEKIYILQEKIQEITTEIEQLTITCLLIPEKEQLVAAITLALPEKEELGTKKKQLDDLFTKTLELITRNELLLSQSREIKEKIRTVDLCPTCQQHVSTAHKHQVTTNEEKKIAQAENLLFEAKKQRALIEQQLEDLSIKLETLRKNENNCIKLKAELAQLQEKKLILITKQQQLKMIVQEYNNIMAQLHQSEELARLQEELKQKQQIIAVLHEKKYLELQQKEIQKQKEKIAAELSSLLQQGQSLQDQAHQKNDLATTILEKKNAQAELVRKERVIAIQQGQIKIKIEHLQQQEQEILHKIAELQQEEQKLIRLQELYHWLEDHFLPLTYGIEKQVMGSIHTLFNQLFQEWFSLLINDDNIYARLDDSCSPLIELNGYDVGFNNLSGGEKTSAALAYRLALNRVINDIIHDIKTKNILILDEPTDGFSTEQLDKVREVLERLQLGQTIIVSHESKIESFVQNVIRVHKEGHVSHIITT